MSREKYAKFAAELNMLAAATRGLVTDPLLKVFWEEFGSEDLEDWHAACHKARRSLDFFPSIREMRAFLPARPRPIDPLLKRLLTPYERKEPWPAHPLIGTPEFPAPRPTEQTETELDRAVRARLRELQGGGS